MTLPSFLPWRRVAAELALLAAGGLFMALIGPYGTVAGPLGWRLWYWEACIVGGGLIGVALDLAFGRRLAALARVAAVSAAMTPLVTLWVLAIGGGSRRPEVAGQQFAFLFWQVLFVCVPIMALRVLLWRAPPPPRVETRTVVAPPLPEAEAAFRRRLSAKRRTARLLAVEADDHYLRVHTDAGEELVTLRFADALAELERAHGFRTHRSWWVAADAIERVSWRRGVGEARLAGGLTAPVSRTYAPQVKAAGWF